MDLLLDEALERLRVRDAERVLETLRKHVKVGRVLEIRRIDVRLCLRVRARDVL